MKKLFLAAALAIGLAFTSNAQEISENAIGIRLGDNDGFGTEISYQRALGGNNRLEANLGWRNNDDYDSFKLVGLYQWIWNIEGGFNWYAGVGAGLGSYTDNRKDKNDSGAFVMAAGSVGIEYNFDIPLMISLDLRPEVYIGNSYRDGFGRDLGLSFRYQF
jgi:opacity protein-like surface antigen